MALFETFKQRKLKAARAGKADIYQYDAVPPKLRVQLGQIFVDAIGGFTDYDTYRYSPISSNNQAWMEIRKLLCRAFGKDFLVREDVDARADIINFVRMSTDVDEVLSAIEICCRMIDAIARTVPQHEYQSRQIVQQPDDAIREINYWFRESAIGYQFESGQLIRVDSQFAHAEIVKPALALLSDPRFSGPEKEYLQAHQHYRAGQHKDAVVWANKAFESTMKVACDIRRWSYPTGARASDLLKVLRKNNLLPDYLDGSFDQLSATLASGLPKVRNEEGGHGDGNETRNTPGYIAAYALHLAAAKIVLIAEATLAKH